MSIAALASGDTVVVETITTTRGEAGSQVRTPVEGASLDCAVQTPSASEIRSYQARGMKLDYWAFFSSDPSLTTNDRLKWMTRRAAALAIPIYLRVLDCYAEGRPGASGEDMLWVADCEQVTSRTED